MIGPDDFAALARSSPWRWRTAQFTLRWSGSKMPDDDVRAWLRRPNDLRVESLADGIIRRVERRGVDVTPYPDRDSRPWAAVPAEAVPLDSADSYTGRFVSLRTVPLREWDKDPVSGNESSEPGRELPSPTLRADGLVDARPADAALGDFDAPMWQNYYWVALLDPIELADGRDDVGRRGPGGTVISDVEEVRHHGRPAWQATVAPTATYEPRCGCCSLMRSRRIDVLEYGHNRPDVLLDEYPTAYRVRLDRQTGICVYLAALGGSVDGAGHDVEIAAVDEPMDDGLFNP